MDSSLKEIKDRSSLEEDIKTQIECFYEKLQELGYLLKDLYEMDMNELESTLINRRKGIAYECFMVGMLSRTALAKDMPDTPEKAFPFMFPPKKTYKMPDFLRNEAIETLRERGVNIGN